MVYVNAQASRTLHMIFELRIFEGKLVGPDFSHKNLGSNHHMHYTLKLHFNEMPLEER